MAVAVFAVFLTSLRAIGVAATIIGVGFLGTKLAIVAPEDSKVLLRISKNICMPALLFSRILYCNQCAPAAHESCPSCSAFSEIIGSAWILALLPMVVVPMGFIVGKLTAEAVNAPSDFFSGTICAIALGNSTGLPMVLLTVVTQSITMAGANEEHPMVMKDPLLHLPAYLMLYPILQWGLGTYILKPEEEEMKFGQGSDCTLSVRIMREISQHLLEPPIIATLLGLLLGLTPFRGLFIDLQTQERRAMLEWLYDGIYKLGDAAVPLNTLMLGSSLAGQFDLDILPLRVCLAIAFSKMLLMPLLMTAVIYCLIHFVDAKDASVWLVAFMVTSTPTANNVLIMAQSLGSHHRECMAAAIFVEYLVAPFLLTTTLTYFLWLLSCDWYLPVPVTV